MRCNLLCCEGGYGVASLACMTDRRYLSAVVHPVKISTMAHKRTLSLLIVFVVGAKVTSTKSNPPYTHSHTIPSHTL